MSDSSTKPSIQTTQNPSGSAGGILSQALSDQPISRYIDVPAQIPEPPKKDLTEVAKKDAEVSEKLIQEAKQKLEEIKTQNNPINLSPVQNTASRLTAK